MSQTQADTRSSAAGADGQLDAIVIGAGFAGMYMVHRLRELGFTVHGFEAGDDVGGTWYWNRYPGARCDSESMYYSYSFLPELEQEWPLDERYPGQPEILRYLRARGRPAGAARGLHLQRPDRQRRLRRRRERVDGAHRGRHAGLRPTTWSPPWAACRPPTSRCSRGPSNSRAGRCTPGAWPHEPVDFTGQRVGVIGTGASGIQAIPVIAEQAGHLTVFQRTAQFTIPAANGPLDRDFVAMWKQNYQEWRRRGRYSRGRHPLPGQRDLGARGIARRSATRPSRARGTRAGSCSPRAPSTTWWSTRRPTQTAADFVRAKIERDRARPGGGRDAQAARPSRSGPSGCRWTPTTTRPSTGPTSRWSTCARTPIEEITPAGIRTAAGEYELDIIVYATGFDALTGPLFALGIRGRDGKALADAWAEGPKTYLGLAVPEFPNLFTITGPGSPSVLSNMPVSIEQHVEWIGDCLAYLREHGIDDDRGRQPDAMESWTEHVQAGRRPHPVPEGRVLVHGRQHPRASRGCSCPTSAGSATTGTSATRSRPTATRASTWPRHAPQQPPSPGFGPAVTRPIRTKEFRWRWTTPPLPYWPRWTESG